MTVCIARRRRAGMSEGPLGPNEIPNGRRGIVRRRAVMPNSSMKTPQILDEPGNLVNSSRKSAEILDEQGEVPAAYLFSFSQPWFQGSMR